MIISTRKEALEAGLKTYFSGRDCKHGHKNPERKTSDGGCIKCKQEYYSKNRDSIIEKVKSYRSSNAAKISKRNRKYYISTREQKREYNRKYYSKNKDTIKKASVEYRQMHSEECKLRDAIYRKKYLINNRGHLNSLTADRRNRKTLRTPPWANKTEIRKFYILAEELTKQTGISYHVDHIIPLNGKLVSGLHIENNLRVIPAIENIKKGNKLIEDLLL